MCVNKLLLRFIACKLLFEYKPLFVHEKLEVSPTIMEVFSLSSMPAKLRLVPLYYMSPD